MRPLSAWRRGGTALETATSAPKTDTNETRSIEDSASKEYHELKRNQSNETSQGQQHIERDIERQSSASLQRGIKAYEKQISLHYEKINRPEMFLKEWGSFDERYRAGLLRHWEKEINNWEQSIQIRELELKKRGEKHE